jgi:hypothetical protein
LHGFPGGYASKIENIASNQNGDNVTVTALAGDCLVAIAIGLRANDSFDDLHSGYSIGTGTAAGYFRALPDSVGANPSISDNSSAKTATITNVAITTDVATITAANSFQAGDSVKLTGLTTATFLNNQTVVVLSTGLSATQFEFNFTHADYPSAADTGTATSTSGGNDWALVTNLNLTGLPAPGSTGGGSDYTPGATPPAAPNPYPASNWNIDGYYPSLYIWAATGVAAGTYQVNLKSMFNNPTSTSDLTAGAQAAGRPIFAGGVNFQVIRFSGVQALNAQDGHSIGNSVAAKSGPPAFATTQGSELLLSVGLMKSGNVFSLGHVNQGGADTADAVTMLSQGKLVGSEAHYMVSYATPAASSATTYLYFSNPLGYEMLVGNIALKHS